MRIDWVSNEEWECVLAFAETHATRFTLFQLEGELNAVENVILTALEPYKLKEVEDPYYGLGKGKELWYPINKTTLSLIKQYTKSDIDQPFNVPMFHNLLHDITFFNEDRRLVFTTTHEMIMVSDDITDEERLALNELGLK